jgi:hypothetical protein
MTISYGAHLNRVWDERRFLEVTNNTSVLCDCCQLQSQALATILSGQ